MENNWVRHHRLNNHTLIYLKD